MVQRVINNINVEIYLRNFAGHPICMYFLCQREHLQKSVEERN